MKGIKGISCTLCSVRSICDRCKPVKKYYSDNMSNLAIDITDLVAYKSLDEVIIVLQFLKETGFTEFALDGSDGSLYAMSNE